MKIRIGATVVLLIAAIAGYTLCGMFEGPVVASAGIAQLNGSSTDYAIGREVIRTDFRNIVFYSFWVLLLLMWAPVVYSSIVTLAKGEEMKKLLVLLMLGLAAVAMQGCIGPVQLEQIEQIKSNETAFLVNLEGDNQKNQDMFKSAEFLAKQKVPTKQVSIAQRKLKTGRLTNDFKWIPAQKLLKVNRTPVTREWTKGAATGTKAGDQSIHVEDNTGIGFAVGVNITCSIAEEDAASYLYKYAEQELASVVDQNVRGTTQSILSGEFANLPLDKCVSSKGEITKVLLTGLREIYKPFGISIDSVGFAEGITFDNPEIQKGIDQKFQSEVAIKTAENEAKALVQKSQGEADAQVKRNEMKVAMAKAEREAAEEFQKAMEAQKAKLTLEAIVGAMKQWDGKLPTYLIASGSGDMMKNLSMFLPSPVAVQ